MTTTSPDAWHGSPPYSEANNCPSCGRDSCDEPEHPARLGIEVPPSESDADQHGGSVTIEDLERDTADDVGGNGATPKELLPVGARLPAREPTERQNGEDRNTGNDEDFSLDDFLAYMPMHSYVNARISPVTDEKTGQKVKASTWLDRYRHVELMTWAPGEPTVVADRLVDGGAWIERRLCSTLNLYRPPTIALGDATKAKPWLAHLERTYPDDAEHISKWLAHRVQRPAEKINHGLVLGGEQGIGKDTILEPAKTAVGPWNFSEISPVQLLGRFNGFVKSVILRISEARDMGDVNRYAFYEHLKAYTAAPPDVLRCDEKNVREYDVFNVCGVVLTTNHKTSGIYLPPGDRRHYVAWSDRKKDDFTPEYWHDLYNWYDGGGRAHVSAYLTELDLSVFDAKAPPPKTPAFWEIVEANRNPDDAEFSDLLEMLNNPPAVTISQIAKKADRDLSTWLSDRRNARQVPHRLYEAGYVQVRSDSAKDGRWRVSGRRQVVYALGELSLRDRIVAARELAERSF